jgi:hypothetical protein
MITIWSKEKSSGSVLNNLALDQGIYDLRFSKNIISKVTILELMKSDAARGSVYKTGNKEIRPIQVIEREKDFSIIVEVSHNANIPVSEASFVSVSVMLGLLGIIAITFLIEVRKTFTNKTGFGIGLS